MLKRCVSCGRNTKDFAEFPSPNSDFKVVRCHYCRENRNKYETPDGFVGP
ncbi:MAG: RNA-binding protein [Candidatus Bilamarchaeum sp.]